jgi:hypothetical protein
VLELPQRSSAGTSVLQKLRALVDGHESMICTVMVLPTPPMDAPSKPPSFVTEKHFPQLEVLQEGPTTPEAGDWPLLFTLVC